MSLIRKRLGIGEHSRDLFVVGELLLRGDVRSDGRVDEHDREPPTGIVRDGLCQSDVLFGVESRSGPHLCDEVFCGRCRNDIDIGLEFLEKRRQVVFCRLNLNGVSLPSVFLRQCIDPFQFFW